MGSLLNVGARALQSNQVALQTAGNNIANVNTPGYSRQTVVLQTVEGQYTGGGYIGNGVDVQTITRNFSTFLTRQSGLAGATSAADSTRADNLKQLEGIFTGGPTGLGAAINDMLNGFSDVASAPTDLTARTVVLTRVDETAARMRAASQSLGDLQQSVEQELSQKVDAINSLAQGIASVNDQIVRTRGSGQPANDLLDRRDQLVRDLNQYVQTTSIAADDGTVGIFIGGSQALVLGTTASPVLLVKGDGSFGDTSKSKLAISRSGQITTLDENTLGGGEVSGLLRFQNTDLAEGRNLLGRLTLAVTTAMNDQHKLGLDLDGNAGGNLFSSIDITNNVTRPTPSAPPAPPVTLNATTAMLTLAVSDTSKFVASDYEVNFSSPTAGTITRQSDGKVFSFPQTPATVLPILATIDGLNISLPATPLSTGDRFLLKPFSTSASSIKSEFSSPRALAVAGSVAASASSTNKGTLAVERLTAKTVATPLTGDKYSLNFSVVAGAATYKIYNETTDPAHLTALVAASYVPGQAIEYNPGAPTPGWSLMLTGAPANNDTFAVQPQPAANRNLNAGNANAMMDLRDVAMFDGAALTDGYAGLMAQIGIRSQSANYAAEVSGSIAANLERDRASVSGVNLDEEAAKLLQFQQAYQASAKMIQIAQSIFDTLIQSLGR